MTLISIWNWANKHGIKRYMALNWVRRGKLPAKLMVVTRTRYMIEAETVPPLKSKVTKKQANQNPA